MDNKLNEFYSAQVKDLLSDKYTMIFDMFRKSENDDFTVGEMFEIICNERPLYLEGFLVNKLNDVLYWLSYAPSCSKNPFFDIKTEDFCNYLSEKTEKQNLPEMGEISLLSDDFYCFLPKVYDEPISLKTTTLGELISGLNNIIEYHNFVFFNDVFIEKEYAEISERALNILGYIFFNPYYYLFHKK